MIDVYGNSVPVEICSLIEYAEDGSDCWLRCSPRTKRIAKAFKRYHEDYMNDYTYARQKIDPTRVIFDEIGVYKSAQIPFDKNDKYAILKAQIGDMYRYSVRHRGIPDYYPDKSSVWEDAVRDTLCARARTGRLLTYSGSCSESAPREFYKGLALFAYDGFKSGNNVITVDVPKYCLTVTLAVRYEPYVMLMSQGALPDTTPDDKEHLQIDVMINANKLMTFNVLENKIIQIAQMCADRDHYIYSLNVCGRCTHKHNQLHMSYEGTEQICCEIEMNNLTPACICYYPKTLNLVDDILYAYYMTRAGKTDTSGSDMSIEMVGSLKAEREAGVVLLPQDYAVLFEQVLDLERNSRRRVKVADLPEYDVGIEFTPDEAANKLIMQTAVTKLIEGVET